MKIIITDTQDFQVQGSHANLVLESFKMGYESGGEGPFPGVIVTHGAIWDFAKVSFEQPDIWVQSYVGAVSQLPNLTTLYPTTTAFFPTGSNSLGELFPGSIPQLAVLTGAGDTGNETADNIEFYAPDPTGEQAQDYSSFSNAFIAGKIAFIATKRNCSIWEARYVSRITGSEMSIFHPQNGFGKIDIQRAVAFTGLIVPDPFIAVPPPPPPPVGNPIGITKETDTIYGNSNFLSISSYSWNDDEKKGTYDLGYYLNKDNFIAGKRALLTQRLQLEQDHEIKEFIYNKLNGSLNGTIEQGL